MRKADEHRVYRQQRAPPSTAEDAGAHAMDRPSTVAATRAETMRMIASPSPEGPRQRGRGGGRELRRNDGCRAKRRPSSSPLRGLGRHAVVRERARVERARSDLRQRNDVDRAGQRCPCECRVAQRCLEAATIRSLRDGCNPRGAVRGAAKIGRLDGGYRRNQTTRKGSGADATHLRRARSPTPRTVLGPWRFARRRPPP